MSSPGPPEPACIGGRPPRTCPGRHTESPGCAGFSVGLGSHSLPAEQQPQLHCYVDAALWGVTCKGQRSAPMSMGGISELTESLIPFACTEYCGFKKQLDSKGYLIGI